HVISATWPGPPCPKVREADARRRAAGRAGSHRGHRGTPAWHVHASGAGETPAPLDGLRPGEGLAGRDLDVDGGADLGVQPDPDLVRAHGFDRVADLDPAPVELVAALLPHACGGARRDDRAVQAAAAASPLPHPHL